MKIYKIRIILDTQEDVFRDLEIEETANLEDFHNAIIQSFGFDGNEMASFYRSDEQWSQGKEIPLFNMEDGKSMSDFFLSEILKNKKDKLIYIYDYMIMWTFFVELANIDDKPEIGKAYPFLLFSSGILPEVPPEKTFETESEDDNFSEFDDNFSEEDFDNFYQDNY